MEQELTKMEGLQYTIVRPAIVYGPGDKHGLSEFLYIYYKIFNKSINTLLKY